MTKAYSKLRGKIVEVCGSQREFADRINTSEQTVTAKLSGRASFSMDDIVTWANALGLKTTEVGDYFFATKVSKS